MVDDRTPNLNLPLPHVDNPLEFDVDRVREALGAVDTKFGALDALLASDDATLDAVQELVNQIKANRTDIQEVLTDKANATDLNAAVVRIGALELMTEREETHVLTEGQTDINLTVLTSTAGASVYVEGVRLKAAAWTPHGTIATRLTLNTTYPAGHEVTVVRRQ